METANGRLQLVVSSKKVLVRVERIEDSFMTWDGQVRVNRRRVKVYDYVFDDGQVRALKAARDLASASGLELVVTDLARQSALRRIMRSGMGRLGAQWRAKTSPKAAPTLAQGPEVIRPQVCRP